MSTRERWTIYPLLFLALGAALRSKVTATIETGHLDAVNVRSVQMSCEDLVIVDKDGKPRLRMATVQNAGRVEIYGAGGNIVAVIATEANGASVQLQTADGKPQVLLRSGGAGGLVATVDAQGRAVMESGRRIVPIVVDPIPAAKKPLSEPADDVPAKEPESPRDEKSENESQHNEPQSKDSLDLKPESEKPPTATKDDDER